LAKSPTVKKIRRDNVLKKKSVIVDKKVIKNSALKKYNKKIKKLEKKVKSVPKKDRRLLKRKILKYKVIKGGNKFFKAYKRNCNQRIERLKAQMKKNPVS
jgi:Fe2+ transport system protein B